MLFKETVRFNLDPFNEHTDSEIWAVLEEVKVNFNDFVIHWEIYEAALRRFTKPQHLNLNSTRYIEMARMCPINKCVYVFRYS